MNANPCRLCGACCAHYRVSFYWGETDDVTPNGVPAALTDDLTPFRRVMKGTNQVPPRCIALCGEIGQRVWCAIYEQRPQVCRDLPASYSDGAVSEHCDKARLAHELPPLKELEIRN